MTANTTAAASAEKPTVHVVDDDASVRKGLGRLLGAAGYDVELFERAGDFIDHMHHEGPACLVLDVRLPDQSGLDLQEALSTLEERMPIIFITGHGDIPMTVRAMKAGAVDFLAKPFDESVLLNAIEAAIRLDQREFQHQRKLRITKAKVAGLTEREHEVFRYVITGMLNKQIAAELGIAEKTVKVHRGRVMQKLGVVSVAELVRLAAQLDIEGPEQKISMASSAAE